MAAACVMCVTRFVKNTKTARASGNFFLSKDLVKQIYDKDVDLDYVIAKEWNQINHIGEFETKTNKKFMIRKTKQKYKHLKESALLRQLRIF